MVSLGVAHFTVLTLAIYISNTVSAEPFVVHHECEGKAFCHIKPDNYPQEEIDRLVIKNLPHLHRMKRSAPAPPLPLADPSTKGNCATKPIKMKKPYLLNENKKKYAPYIIVQSGWFDQEVPEVSCREENSECFQSLLNVLQKNTYCKKKTVSSEIFIYNNFSNALEPISTNIDIDCVCVVGRD